MSYPPTLGDTCFLAVLLMSTNILLFTRKLLQKGVIMKVKYSLGQIVSGIFLLPKKDGTFRLILNLKSFNEFLTHHHFKMDSLQSIIKLVTPSCFMASIDMKDAYPSLLKLRIESICVLNGQINFMNSLVFPMGCRVPPADSQKY